MKHHLRTIAVAVFAFALGATVTHLPQAAKAAAPALTPMTLDILAITRDQLPPPSATFPNLRSKTYIVDDGMTLSVQMGTAFKHYHAGSDEIQIIADGTGTEWLGDTPEVRLDQDAAARSNRRPPRSVNQAVLNHHEMIVMARSSASIKRSSAILTYASRSSGS
jgi:hypothetical protein